MLRMVPGIPGTDRFTTQVSPDRQGMWTLVIEAWSDPLGTWRHAVVAKAGAHQSGEEMANDLETGARLLERIARRPQQQYATAIRGAVAALRDVSRSVAERIGPALSGELWPVLAADPIRELITRSPAYQVWVDQPLAEFGSWYEFFPRSSGSQVDEQGLPVRHGTFADAQGELPRVAAMGFDVVYLPPIHPIGEVNRKGRNSASEPGGTINPDPRDVGSPWAIGSAAGGHDAVHPALGTIEDFDAFVARAGELGLTVALDFALQCAPDHPWVAAHPEWFTTKPDGTIAYAENPPKKYQDIYPLNFDNDAPGLYAEALRVLRFWISHGVTVFRVDNPHTKPINFWEWLIAQVHAECPEAIFLAEAFTKPAMMHELAKVGFTQSYTYFTWRTGKQELVDYGVDLVSSAHYMRPNFFVNTPDILHASLQYGGPAMFAIRAVLAATMSPTWGVYSGYELFEHEAVRPGSEEYRNSEKYALPPAGLPGRARAGAFPAAPDLPAQRDPPSAPGAAEARRALVPRHRQRLAAVLLAVRQGDRRPGDRRRRARLVGAAVGGDRPEHAGPGHGVDAALRGRRRAVGRDLPVGRPQHDHAGADVSGWRTSSGCGPDRRRPARRSARHTRLPERMT